MPLEPAVLAARIFGDPIAQGRPRAFKTPRGQIRVYDPATARDWKRTVQSQVLPQKPPVPLEGPLAMDLVFLFRRPRSLPKRILYHTTRPDADNCAKAIKDALRGIVYRDDSQIVDLHVTKQYGPAPGVVITIRYAA